MSQKWEMLPADAKNQAGFSWNNTGLHNLTSDGFKNYLEHAALQPKWV